MSTLYIEYHPYIFIELWHCRSAGLARTNDWVLKVNYW